MKDYLAILKKTDIFKNMEIEYIENIIKEKDYKIASYDKGDVIALEDSECNSVGIVLSGNIEIQRIYESGRSLIVQRFVEGNTFGEAIVFSQKILIQQL
ncbi:MAG: cyclic nucleotide-binding domain-containing protein [Clostridium sp.]